MRPIPQILLTTALVAVAGLGGYFLGSSEPRAHPGPAAAEANASNTRTGRSPGEIGAAGAIESTLAGPNAADQQRRARLFKALFEGTQGERKRRKAWLAADELTLEDIPAALEMMQKTGARGVSEILPLILGRWAELDPQAAAAHALALKGVERSEHEYAVGIVAAEWAKQDRVAAQKWATGLEDPAQARKAVQGVIRGLAESDPAAALNWLGGLPEALRTANAYQALFLEWTALDPRAAAQQALALPADGTRAKVLWSIANQWAESNPEAAYAWVGQIPELGQRMQATSEILRKWAGSDPEAAMAEALKLPDATRMPLLPVLIWTIASRDLDLALKLVEQMPEGPERTRAFRYAQEQLGLHDPRAAAELALTWKPGVWRNRMLSIAMQRWGADSPVEVLEFVGQRLPDSQVRKNVESMALSSWAQNYPRAALDWLLKKGRNSPGDLASAIEGWSRQDPTAALAWARAQPGAERSQAERAAIVSLASLDPSRAEAEFAQLPEDKFKADTAAAIALGMVWQNPAASAKWLSRLEDQGAHGEAMRSVAATWAVEDQDQSAAWLKTLPAGLGRDNATRGYAQAVAEMDPASSAAWAESIGDQAMREETLKTVYQQWKSTDAKAANLWLEGSKVLSAETVTKWRN